MEKTTRIFTNTLIGACLLFGAFSVHAASLTVNSTADAGPGSLRQAIIDATINTEANLVTFSVPTTDPGYDLASNSFTIELLSALPDLPLAAITLNNGQSQKFTVKGNNSFRIFTLVNSAVVTINNLTISNGFSSTIGGAIFMGKPVQPQMVSLRVESAWSMARAARAVTMFDISSSFLGFAVDA